MIIKKETSLEIQSQNTKETLNWKLEQLTNNNLPVEQGIADYIYFGVSNIDAKIKQLKSYKDEILKEVKNLEAYKSNVSEEKEETSESVKFVLDVSNKTMEEHLVSLGYAHYEKVTTTKITLATKDKIRINSKRK